MEEREMFYNGFCRTINQGRLVVCVYVKKEGEWVLDEAGCAYENCPHRDACEVGRQILEGA